MGWTSGTDETWALTAVPPGVADRTVLLFVKAARELERRGVERLRALDIDGRDYLLLAVLSGDDAGSQAQLATQCSLLPGQIVPVLDALEAKGLVERRRDERDRRRSIVRITDAGRELLAQADDLARETAGELLGDTGDEVRERLARSLAAAVADGAPSA